MRKIVVIILITVIILLTSSILIMNKNLKYKDNEINKTVIIFIKSDAALNEIEEFKLETLKIKEVKKIIKYKTKEMIKDEMILENAKLGEVIDEYGDNLPFNPVLIIEIDNVKDMHTVVNKLQKFDIVENIVYNKKTSIKEVV